MSNPARYVLFLGYLAALPFPTAQSELPTFVAAADPISAACLKPMKGDFAQPDRAGLQAEEVSIANGAGHELRAWFFPAPDAKQSILFCMGNSGNISLMLPYAKILRDAGYEVLLFDYQGFGESEGFAAISSLLTDSLAAFDYLQTRTQRPPKDIGVFGVSLGSILALTVAAEKQAGAVAVEDAFIPDETIDRFSRRLTADSPFAKVALHGMKSLLLGRVDPLRNIARLKGPVFLMHGVRDKLLPPSGTVRIANKATTPRRVWLMPDTGHAPESLETNDREYAAQLSSFFHAAFANTLDEPLVQWRWQLGDSDPDWPLESPGEVTITVTEIDRPQPLMLMITDSKDASRTFSRPTVPHWATAQTTIPMNIPVPPFEIFAVRYHHVMKDETSWKPDLSDFSLSLVDYHNQASQILGDTRRADLLTRSNGYGFTENPRLIPQFPTAAAINLLKHRNGIENAPPRIQARYARLLARLHCWPQNRLGNSPPKDLSIFGENMLEFLPTDPDTYYELQNAGILLGFRDTMVGDSLFRLAKKRLIAGQPEAAQELLRKHVSVLPAQAPTNLTEERIRSINTLEDLIGPAR